MLSRRKRDEVVIRSPEDIRDEIARLLAEHDRQQRRMDRLWDEIRAMDPANQEKQVDGFA
jgi:uncharacterized coiled-coil protein SlyX